MAKQIKLHLPWMVWLITIFVLSLTPGDQLPEIKFDLFKIDTVVHVIMYLLLAFLMLIGFFHQKNELSGQSCLYIFVTAVLIGLGIEYLQGNFVFQRYFSWSDFLANSLGAIAGYLAFRCTRKKS